MLEEDDWITPPQSGDSAPQQDADDWITPAPGSGYRAEAVKGFARGAQGMLTSPLQGVAAAQSQGPAAIERAGLSAAMDRVMAGEDPAEAVENVRAAPPALPPVTDSPGWRAAEAIKSTTDPYLAPAQGWEDSWTADIAGGFGSVATGIGMSLLNPGAAMLMFVTAGQGEAAERAQKAGATPEQIQTAARLGTVSGATDVVDALLPMMGSYGKTLGLIKRVGYTAVAGALAEGGQEGLQQFIQNAIAKGVYKPDQDLGEGVTRSMAVGAIVGGGVGGASGAFQRKEAAAEDLPSEYSDRARTAPSIRAPVDDWVTPEADRTMQELDAILAEDSAPAEPEAIPPGSPPPAPPVSPSEPDMVEDSLAELARRDAATIARHQAGIITDEEFAAAPDPDDMGLGYDPASRPVSGRNETPQIEDEIETAFRSADLSPEEALLREQEGMSKKPTDEVVEKIDTPVEAEPQEGGPTIEFLPPGALNVDAKRFQYKGGADEKGVTGALKGIEKWDDRLANPILAWQAKDGTLYVANGHQRTDLAKRAEAAGQEGVRIPTRILREADGYTPEFMRALGAFQNIAEGTGTAVDAAKVLRANEAKLSNVMPPLPPRSQLVQDAKALQNLSDDAFGMVVNDIVPESFAAQVGRILKEPAEQLAAMDVLAKASPANVDQARIMVEDIRNAGFLKGEQTGLFGEAEFAKSLVAERARILDRAVKTLRKLGTTFKTAVEQEGTLAEAGNKLEREANVKARTENERLAEILAKDGTRKGPISDALSDAARELAGGKQIGNITSQFLSKVRSLTRGNAARVQSGPETDRDGSSGEQGALYSIGRGPRERAVKPDLDAPLSRDELAKIVKEKFPHGYKSRMSEDGKRIWIDHPGASKSALRSGMPNTLGEVEAMLSGIRRIERMEARAAGKPTTEPVELAKGEKGEQFVIPGAEKAGQGAMAQRGADAPLKPKKAQKPADFGLFGSDKDQGSLFSIASPFYSAVGRVVENAKQAKAPASQWLGMLRNAPGVKPEEMEWLGIEPWLNEQKGSISKDAVLDYIRANSIELKEVQKGGPETATSDEKIALREELDQLERDGQLGDPNAEIQGSAAELFDGVMRGDSHAIGDVEGLGIPDDIIAPFRDRDRAPTKFSQYTIPGGENYREMLLTLPVKTSPQGDAVANFAKAAREAYGERWTVTAPETIRQQYDELIARQERLGREAAEEQNYKSAHWEERNILAHVRFNDRVIDGKKTLFLEELQSDWHQAGKKKGYDDGGHWTAEPAEFAPGIRGYQVRDAAGRKIADVSAESAEAAVASVRKSHGRAGTVPDAPFKTTWPELILKRMIRYAAENGYEKIAWTPGDVQAERYDLSKHVKEIEYIKRGNEYELGVTDKNGEGVRMSKPSYTAEELPDVVGKEIAEKIVNGEGKRYRGHEGTTLDGLDLKVGGEGMKGFYDEILPATANKLVKKYGARVRAGSLPSDTEVKIRTATDTGGGWEVYRTSDDFVLHRTVGLSGAQSFASDYAAKAVHTLDITPPLRDAALSQGFPLFDIGRDLTKLAQQDRKEIERRITAVARQVMGPHVRVEFQDRIPLPDSALEAWGSAAKGLYTAAGRYIPAHRLINIAMTDPAYRDQLGTAYHELFHGAENLILRDREMAVLKAEDANLRQIAAEYAGMSPEQASELAGFEVRAIAAQAYADMRNHPQSINSLSGAAIKVLERLRQLFRRIRNVMRGLGYQTSQDIFSDFYEGRMAGREARPRAFDAAADIGGAQSRPRLWLNDAIRGVSSPEFLKWFGGSKVVDDGGRPKTVYHGTAKGGFDSFDTYGSNYGLMGQGSYFTEDPGVASQYTGKGLAKLQRGEQAPAQSVYPAYLSIKRPIDMDGPADIAAWAKQFSDYVGTEDFADAKTNEDAYRVVEEFLSGEQIPTYEGAEIMQDGLRGMGFDGITHMGGGRVGDGVRHRVWIAFDPEQVKSPFNRGTYDPSDPRILFSVTPQPAALYDVRGSKLDPVSMSRFIRGEISADELAPGKANWAKIEDYLGKNFNDAARARMGEAMDAAIVGDYAPLEALSDRERAAVSTLFGHAGGKPPAPPRAAAAVGGGGKKGGSARQRILDRIVPSDKNESRLPSLNQVYTLAKDDLNPIRVLRNELTGNKDIPIEQDPYRLARLARGAFGKGEQMIENATFTFGNLTNNGKGLIEILKPVKNDLDGFRAYMAARRAMELHGRGIKTGIAAADAQEVVRDGASKYATPFSELVAYQRRVLDYLRDSGIIGVDAYQAMVEANKDYVPFFRLMEDGAAGQKSNSRALRVKQPIKGIKGSSREIIDPIESIIRNTYLYVALAEKNRALTALDDLAAKSPKGEEFVVVKKDKAPTKGAKELLDFLKENGIDVDPATFEAFKPEGFRPTSDTISFYRDGKREVRIVSPDVAEAVNAMDRETFGLLLRVLSAPARMLRTGATLAPEFIVRNPIRDQFTAAIYSEHGYIPIWDFVKGLGSVLRNDASYQDWLKAGGANSTLVSMDRKYIDQEVMKLKNPTALGKLKNVVRSPLDFLRMLSELTENATRVGEFKKAVRKGKSKMEAGFSSREATLDFARMGAQMRAVNAMVPFFNASVEGTDREIRGFAKRPMATTFKVAALITLPSVLLWFANHDDERYAEIPQWQKDLFWLVFTKDNVWRIPKPFALGLLFGSVPERVLDAFYAKKPTAFKGLGKAIKETFLPNMIPAFLAPGIEQFANRSSFTDRSIVPKYLEGLLPRYQYAPYTSDTAKLLGKSLSKIPGMDQSSFASPMVIDNYIRAWTGGIGQYVVKTADKALRATGVAPTKVEPTMTPADMPVIKAFAVRHPSGQAQSIQDFYDTYEERKKARDTVRYLTKLGDKEPAAAVTEDRNLETVDRIGKALSQQMKFARDVWFNNTMTPEDKRRLIDQTYFRAIEIAKLGNKVFRDTEAAKKRNLDAAKQLESAQ